MKRQLLVTLLLLLGVSLAEVRAQESPSTTSQGEVRSSWWDRVEENWRKPNLECKHEIRIGGIHSLEESISDAMTGSYYYHPNPQNPYEEYEFSKHTRGEWHDFATPSISYSYRLSNEFEVAAKTIYMSTSRNTYCTMTGEVEQSQTFGALYLTPSFRWNFLQGEWARYYAGFGYNLAYITENGVGRGSAEFCFEAGFTLGKKIFFFGESLIYGDNYLNLMGIGYRF